MLKLKPFLSGLTIVFLLLSGCERDNCEDIVCGTNESCIEGRCFCAAGYEGPACADLAAMKYTGNYIVSESCIEGNPSGYTNANIQFTGRVENEIAFVNFLNLGGTAYGYIQTDVNTNAGDFFIIDQTVNGASVYAVGNYTAQNGSARITMDVEYTRFTQYFACTLQFF